MMLQCTMVAARLTLAANVPTGADELCFAD